MRFGSREIADLTFKTTAPNQKIGQKVFTKVGTPCFFIDTARTSSMEQQTSTVYAQGGKGFNRLIAWEGEKTMSFTIEDALISPMGLAILSGAGLSSASTQDVKHVHCTIDATVASGAAKVTLADLRDELGLPNEEHFYVCDSTAIPTFGTVLDASGAGIDYVDEVTLSVAGGETSPYSDSLTVDSTHDLTLTVDSRFNNKTVKFDFYVIKGNGVQEIDIKPQDFGGFFYLEAQTLFRREDTGEDMAAEIIIPKAKVQSAFTIALSASGDPSTFNFAFDAFPAYTRFNKTKKVMCVIQIIGEDNTAASTEAEHKHNYNGPATKKLVEGADVEVSTTEPVSPSDGDYWYDSANDALMVYDGSDFQAATGVNVLATTPTQAQIEAMTIGDVVYVKNETKLKEVQSV